MAWVWILVWVGAAAFVQNGGSRSPTRLGAGVDMANLAEAARKLTDISTEASRVATAQSEVLRDEVSKAVVI